MPNRKLTRRILVAATLIALLAPTALAADPFSDEPPPPQAPKVAFAEYDAVTMSHLTMDRRYPDKKSNAVARQTIDDCLFSKMGGVFGGLKDGAASGSEETQSRTLAIEPHIEAIKFVSGKARFWGGAMAGNSAVRIKVTFRDLQSGEVIADPRFQRRASAVKGSWSVGGTDKGMLQAICNDVVDYARSHKGTRTARVAPPDPPAPEAAPADSGGGMAVSGGVHAVYDGAPAVEEPVPVAPPVPVDEPEPVAEPVPVVPPVPVDEPAPVEEPVRTPEPAVVVPDVAEPVAAPPAAPAVAMIAPGTAPTICLRHSSTGRRGVIESEWVCSESFTESPWVWVGDDSGYRDQQLQIRTSGTDEVCIQHTSVGRRGPITSEWACSTGDRPSPWIWLGDDSGYRQQELRVRSSGTADVCIRHVSAGRRGEVASDWTCSSGGQESPGVNLGDDSGYRNQRLKVKLGEPR